MPFTPHFESLCPQCPNRCNEDVRTRRIANRNTEFRINQVSAIACTFDAIAPGSPSDSEASRTFDHYLEQFASNVKNAGNFLYPNDYKVDAGAVAKVGGDLFEILLSSALWNAATVWNNFMTTGVWNSSVYTCPDRSIPTPTRRIAIVQLPRGYDSTKLFNAETRASLDAFENALAIQDSELRLSCPDIVGIRLPDPQAEEASIFHEPLLDLSQTSQIRLANAFQSFEGSLTGRSLLFAIAAKRSVRSDRLYQPLFEANVLKFLVGEVLKGSSFRFHVYVGSTAGADVRGHYRAASLVSLLRGGTPSRAVDSLHHAVAPVSAAQNILNELPSFPL